MVIHRTGLKRWINCHQTFQQHIHDLYNLGNNNTGNVLNDYNDSTQGIMGIIKDAIHSQNSLRVLGGEWSWTKIAATDGILLNTKPLNLSFKITQSNVSPSYTKTADDLYFAQCGVSVNELNDRLRNRNRSLKTTGASNGQTIAGAVSTGTHGAAIDVGSMSDFVVGLHIIAGPNKHIWLERKSYPVVSDSFVNHLSAELIRNDDLFNAAVVSFGSFGFIHGVMIETDPLFLYEAYRLQAPLDQDLLNLMHTLDFNNAFLPHAGERPYHFQVLINQYDPRNLAHITIMYKRNYYEGYPPPPPFNPGMGPGDDAPAFIGKITQVVPALVPALVNKLVKNTYKPYGKTFGTHAEFFTNTDIRGKVMSTAAGIPVSEIKKVTDLLMKLNKSKGPFVGVFAYRFVKGSKATLGFTRFNPTCVLELDGVFSQQTNRFYNAFWQALRSESIPHTFHWGKIFEADHEQLLKMYTNTNINNWLLARDAILENDDCKKVFTNEIMKTWGLDKNVLVV